MRGIRPPPRHVLCAPRQKRGLLQSGERGKDRFPPTTARMANTIRMGFIGGGHALQEIHLPLFSQMEEVLPLVLCDIRESALKSALRKFGIRETTTQWQDVLQMREIDAVLVTLPNDLHALVAERALRAGKHVLCEKPAALDVAGARAVARAAQESGRLYMMALPHRFDAEAIILKRMVTAGRLGRIHHIRAGMIRRDARPSGWFTERGRSGGGALVQFGTHLLDLVLWLMENPRVERVSALTWQSGGPMMAGVPPLPRTPDQPMQNVEDAASVLLRMDEGRSAAVETAWALDTADDRQYLEVYGDRGGATLWPLRVFGDIDGVPSVMQPTVVPASHTAGCYQTLARRFVDLVIRHERGERGLQPVASADDGIRLAALTHDIYLSAEAGREIEIPAPASAGSAQHPTADNRGVLT